MANFCSAVYDSSLVHRITFQHLGDANLFLEKNQLHCTNKVDLLVEQLINTSFPSKKQTRETSQPGVGDLVRISYSHYFSPIINLLQGFFSVTYLRKLNKNYFFRA